MKERRHHKRHGIEGIRCNVLSPTDVEIINMSAGGAELMADARLEIDREYQLRIVGQKSTFSIKGAVVWSVLSGSRKKGGEVIPVYRAGMKFSEVHSDKMEEVLDFIEHHKQSPEQRIIARFRIAPPEQAVLDYPAPHRVKRVNPEGLLIEAERAFAVEQTIPMELLLDGDRKISFLGRIVSCTERNGTSLGRFDVGVEFHEMPENFRTMLKEFVDSL